MRKTVDKPHNDGQWTAARFKSFIKSALRAATKRWGPINTVRKEAWVERGVYKCVGHGREAHNVRRTVDGKMNIFVDHIEPIVGHDGFKNWDTVIDRMFVEKDKLQLLCKECHNDKSREERKEYYARRKNQD
jgi:hypothetical protein